jgi:hypothetical protein
MIMDCVIRYKNMMLIAKMKFEEFTLKLVHTDLRSQTTMVPPIKYSRFVPGVIQYLSVPSFSLNCVGRTSSLNNIFQDRAFLSIVLEKLLLI